MAREQRSKTRCHRCSDDDDDAVLLLLLLLLGPVGGGCMRRRLEPPPPPGDVVCCRCCAWSSSSCRRAPQACSFPSSRSAPGSSASNSSPLLEDIVWKANEGRWKCCAPDGQAGPLLPRSAAGVASTAAHWERGGRRRRERPAAKCQPASSSCWQQAGPGAGVAAASSQQSRQAVRWIDFSEGRRPAPEGFRRKYGRSPPLWQTGCVRGTAEVMAGGFRVRSPDHGYQGCQRVL
jgi:hypothetical protein